MNAKISKPLFYVLSCTWGLPMTFIGVVVALVLIITGHKPQKWNYCYYFEVGKNWGGIGLGPIFVVNKNSGIYIKNHEHGHGIQNCYFGCLMPFLVGIPSVIRYWYRELRYTKTGKTPATDYDDIWFEGSATRLGTELNNWIKA